MLWQFVGLALAWFAFGAGTCRPDEAAITGG